MKMRLSTFNCENLFGRYGFLDAPPVDQPRDYAKDIKIVDVVTFEPGRSNLLKPKAISEAQRKNTAEAMLALQPDILSVCEVENLTTLRLFNFKYLKNYFDRVVLLDGNDSRGIDVGLLIRKGIDANIEAIRTHADDAAVGGYIATTNILDMRGRLGAASFSRDCLEVDINVGSSALTILCNHLKAQETRDGNDPTTPKRLGQATRVAGFVKRARTNDRLPIVMGDLNKDYRHDDYDGSLNPLVKSTMLYEPVKTLAESERWTHFYASEKSVSQLDYVLIDKKLKDHVTSVEIFRGGLSTKCKQYVGPRIGTVTDKNEASDHCPLCVEIDL
jgi:endonuclease/exonuclease/phosphatase family metal-dependent hydrolase